MVAFRLIDEGKLHLDDDISNYLGVSVRNPSYPDIPITVRMLISHTSSLKNAEYVYGLPAMQEQLASGTVFTSAKPGARMVYNNYAYGVLAAVCEIAGGTGLTTLARDYFFTPMGIDAAFTSALLDTSRVAVLYRVNGSVGASVDELVELGQATQEPAARMSRYAGGLTISAADLAKLFTLLTGDGSYNGMQLLSPQSVETMLTPHCTAGGIERCMPLWKRQGLYGQDTLYYHTGSAYGVYSLYVLDPANDRGVVITTTGASGKQDTYGVYAVCGDIASAVLQHPELF